MESFVRKVAEGRGDADSHKYFLRFGKGQYRRRFLIKLDKGNKLKMRTSFELANDFVLFLNELKELKFSGKILTKEKVPGFESRKKAGVFVYEVEDAKLSDFPGAYYYLLNTDDDEISLKIKKSLPKPGKNEEKVDENFCALDLDLKYWPQLKERFFWDVPEGKKTIVEHELNINEIEMPSGEKDPVKIRELSKRKGTITRKMKVDGNDTEKKYPMVA